MRNKIIISILLLVILATVVTLVVYINIVNSYKVIEINKQRNKTYFISKTMVYKEEVGDQVYYGVGLALRDPWSFQYLRTTPRYNNASMLVLKFEKGELVHASSSLGSIYTPTFYNLDGFATLEKDYIKNISLSLENDEQKLEYIMKKVDIRNARDAKVSEW